MIWKKLNVLQLFIALEIRINSNSRAFSGPFGILLRGGITVDVLVTPPSLPNKEMGAGKV